MPTSVATNIGYDQRSGIRNVRASIDATTNRAGVAAASGTYADTSSALIARPLAASPGSSR